MVKIVCGVGSVHCKTTCLYKKKSPTNAPMVLFDLTYTHCMALSGSQGGDPIRMYIVLSFYQHIHESLA